MPTPEQNVEAYRMLGEIIVGLREAVVSALLEAYGKEWYRSGLPEPVFARLVERKEREKAVDMYDTTYFKIIDYALFGDILDIAQDLPEPVPLLETIVPDPQLLRARLLELQALQEKLAGLRGISESEVAFLSHFHRRMKQASATPARRARSEQAAPKVGGGEPTAPAVPQEKAAAPSLPPPDEEVLEEAEEVEPAVVAPPAEPGEPDGSEQATASADDQRPLPGCNVTRQELAKALAASDHQVVLRALCGEVMTLTGQLWSPGGPPVAKVWGVVAGSEWYAKHATELGLKVLADFYELFDVASEKLRAGVDRTEVQELLKKKNFPHVLQIVGALFQRHHV